ncbi:HAD-IA family hydrolase [Demequina sp. B12]|uniref:HAD family hydrolase n=1 Tax=Demequina sp. B12 TaxID=2992757 RepID=UPI00237A4C36|nr:HAD-IA family hydrolase [Demequina sp. B12]MDE0573769.1 HAD-IA family hydrolase [Demequina sp. B12]
MTAQWTIPATPDRTYAAALFDLDGVLTPTAEVHMKAWAAMFTQYFDRHGITPQYTDADYFAYVDGKPRYDGVDACLRSRGVELPWGEPTDTAGTETVCGIGNVKNDAFMEVLRRDGVDPYPGSLRLVLHLAHTGVPMAVVSSSRNATEVLAASALSTYFPVVVDGNTVAAEGIAGKPAPDMFTLAAQRLGVETADAVVIEDAFSGVEAGAAGDFGLVVGVNRGAGADELLARGAEIVVDDLEELMA